MGPMDHGYVALWYPLTPEFEVWSIMEKMKDEVELILLDEEEEEDWNFDESDNESDDDYVSDQGYVTG